MKNKKLSLIITAAFLLCAALSANAQDFTEQNAAPFDEQSKFTFAFAQSVNFANIEELYAAVNNPANAGNQIVLAPGVYVLSVNDPNGVARPNAGRLELEENMSLRGVVGDRSAVIIDAINLPLSSFNSAPPVPLTAAIRMGRGTNAIEWLTAQNAVNGIANIGTDINTTSTTYIRVAHVASTNSQRGLDVRNFGAAAVGRVIEAEIVDNDLYNNRANAQGAGMRLINAQGANGGIVYATLSGNRSYNNNFGLLVENNRTNQSTITFFSSGDRFYENGLGALVGAISLNLTPSNGNTVNFTARGTSFENNNGFNFFDFGGLAVIAGENSNLGSGGMPNGVNNNTANVTLRNCRFANNQLHDIVAIGARSLPASIGVPGTNNHVRLRLFGTIVPVLETADSIPEYPGGMNSATIIRSPVTSNFDYDGDSRADLSVFRPSNATWYIHPSNSGNFYGVQFGLATDKLVPADYDSDGKTDIAVYRAGTWYLRRSQLGLLAITFGEANDIPQPADFDGDGKAEIAVWRPSNGDWYVYNLATSQFTFFQLGAATDKPVVGDYDGDGRADYAVFRQSNETWYIQRSTDGATQIQFGDAAGNAEDTPVPAD
jgi:hypothetical protein